MTNETHLIMVADFGVLRYRSGSLHNVNSLIVRISISAHSHHTSANSSIILNGIFVPCLKAHWALSRSGVTMLMTPPCS